MELAESGYGRLLWCGELCFCLLQQRGWVKHHVRKDCCVDIGTSAGTLGTTAGGWNVVL